MECTLNDLSHGHLWPSPIGQYCPDKDQSSVICGSDKDQ